MRRFSLRLSEARFGRKGRVFASDKPILSPKPWKPRISRSQNNTYVGVRAA